MASRQSRDGDVESLGFGDASKDGGEAGWASEYSASFAKAVEHRPPENGADNTSKRHHGLHGSNLRKTDLEYRFAERVMKENAVEKVRQTVQQMCQGRIGTGSLFVLRQLVSDYGIAIDKDEEDHLRQRYRAAGTRQLDLLAFLACALPHEFGPEAPQ